MAGSSLDGFGLSPEFAEKLAIVLSKCANAGYDFRISQGLRTPQKQAEYYCKWNKRTVSAIETAAKKLKSDGAPWLSELLLSYKDIARQPNWLTNALPGAGWHQWGEAADCYCYRNGQMIGDGSDPCYKFYADTAQQLGLTAGYYFQQQDSGHLQLRPQATAASMFTWPHIDEVMSQRFGDKVGVALAPSVSAALLAKAPMTSFGPALAALETVSSKSAFFKDDPTLGSTQLKPQSSFDTSSASGALRALANVYNRVGGLIDTLGDQLKIDPVAVLAVWYVESSGRSFTPGLPILRFENHVFYKKWGQANAALFDKHFQFGGHAGISGKRHQNHAYRVSDGDPWRKSHVDDQNVEYEAFRLAQSLSSREAACWSASWGGPQIMGFNHAVCGYGSASALADAFANDERWHVLGFADFCRSNDLIGLIRDQDWHGFGSLYNGDGDVYGPKIAAAFGLKAKLLALPRVGGLAASGPGMAAIGVPSPAMVKLTTATDAIA